MTTGPGVDDPGLARTPASTTASLHDMPDSGSLIGVPWTELVTLRALRGLVILVLAIVMLLWPERTDTVVAVLIGIGMAVIAVTTAWEVVRTPSSRRFGRMVTLAGAIGLSIGLVLHPRESLVTAAQLVGASLVVLTLGDVVVAAWRRRLQAWTMSRDLALGMVGGVLVVFPDQAVTAVVVLGAGVVGALGLTEILTPISTTTRGDDVAGQDRDTLRRAAALDWLANRPDMAEDRDVLRAKVYFEGEQAPTRFARFLALMSFASVIASIGVVVQSTAVVIGAMLIAPLMVPLMGVAMSVPMGWPRRLRRSAAIAGSGIAVAISTGALVGAILPRAIDVSENAEIVSRISPTMVDLAIAVAAGAAGAYALARRDVSDSLPGVAVAIALVPPLTVVGLCWQAMEWRAGNGALLLFLTNAIAIVLAGGGTFVLVGAAPLDRLSASQQRVQTVVAGLFSVALAIVLLLALNGAELARTDLARAGIDDALQDWSDEHPDFDVRDVQVDPDGGIEIDLIGPGDPPGLDGLAADLRASTGRQVPVDIAWVVEQQRTISVGEG